MKVCLVQVPYHAGDERAGSAGGPRRCIEAGAAERLAAAGHQVRVAEVNRKAPFRDTVSASLDVCLGLANQVRQAIRGAEFPLVLAGGCDASKGILSGIDHRAGGVVWFDAHGDFNTPDSTISGFFPGMSMAVITGHCYGNAWAQLGNADPVAETHVVMAGVRQLDPLERELLAASAIQVVHWQNGRPQGSLTACLDALAQRVKDVYVHIDMDALDPGVAPGVVDQPVVGGISLEQLEDAIDAISARFRITAAALATYNPERDQGERTLQSALRIIEIIGRVSAGSDRPRSGGRQDPGHMPGSPDRGPWAR
jgi:arginase